MIVPIIGNVTYSITLDPTVWIFDDRKILLEELTENKLSKAEETDEIEKASKRWEKELDPQFHKPPVNRSIKQFEREKILTSSYVMPLKDFINNAEIKTDVEDVTLVTENGDYNISIDDLKEGYFLFAIDGKPLKEDGPVHFLYQDGANINDPIVGIKKIVIN
ncbi:hypothetical protein GLV94_19450 [Virgibacillus halodenitrificans]|uniref:hypothetical protein n=1 Tax=Virgibacillus halodenitrificans TaxID=1482 RepID=UPI001370DD39|nr:hypothetical protein [Virgibacillus halodenitrificans]MYL47816.1 hypothetical protein [Virgibacillus halodenitrificans]